MSELRLLIKDHIRGKILEGHLDDTLTIREVVWDYVESNGLPQLDDDQKPIVYQLVRASDDTILDEKLTLREAQFTNGELLHLVNNEDTPLSPWSNIQKTIDENIELIKETDASLTKYASQLGSDGEQPSKEEPSQKRSKTTNIAWLIGMVGFAALICYATLCIFLNNSVIPFIASLLKTPTPTPTTIRVTIYNRTNETVICNISAEDSSDQKVYIKPSDLSEVMLRGTSIITAETCAGTAIEQITTAKLKSVGLVWEIYGQDSDGDGLTDAYELDHDINPNVQDTDYDHLWDYEEIIQSETDPLDPDSDNDGLQDGEEVIEFKTDPLNPDTDSDGLSDGDEIRPESPHLPSDPLQKDTDGDGLSDYDEYAVVYPLYGKSTDPYNLDTDGDGFGDGQEMDEIATSPLDPNDPGLPFLTILNEDYNDKPICDVFLRPANRFAADINEPRVHTIRPGDQFKFPLTEGVYHMWVKTCDSEIVDPHYNIAITATTQYLWTVSMTDTDKDGLSDDYEEKIGTDPDNPDSDFDGLSDGDEFDRVIRLWGSNSKPTVWDSDGDGYRDGKEMDLLHTNPLGPTDPPNPPDLTINNLSPDESICEVSVELKNDEVEYSKFTILPNFWDTFWLEPSGPYELQLSYNFDCGGLNSPESVITQTFWITDTAVFTFPVSH